MIIENDEANPTAMSYTCTEAKKATGDCYVGLMQMGAPTAYDTMRSTGKRPGTSRSFGDPEIPSWIFESLVGEWRLKDFKMKIFAALQIPEFQYGWEPCTWHNS
jgi:hypothetical protein